MPRPTLDDAALLRISSCCADVMITAGDTSAPVAELAESFTDRPEASIRRLMRLTFQDLGLRRVWLEAAHETARLIRPAVARLNGTPVVSMSAASSCWTSPPGLYRPGYSGCLSASAVTRALSAVAS
ncbi:hypothetical protein ACFW9D_23425 [Streptomyces sp. NPDC059524]|uniref:hypothetical protein n=1 Tax=Streptomyces sp. NPDC059524 TaxID=3346856 RepID=UPI0036CDA91E